ncbi:dTMP kinase [Stomatohabitans albus]|uniref:dTMP kinase n=1 Tax=Stomatohabitans albus TaxID=3110766 RepID=UPI00300C9282
MFIAFEGGEGAGKSTQIELLKNYLTERGHDVELTREPGGTPVAEAMRDYVLNPANTIDALEECFIIATGRASHVAHRIRPALAAGKTVITDRFVYSSYVYQGIAGGLGLEKAKRINEPAIDGCEPDLIILLDIEASTGVARARQAKDGGDRLDQASMAFHEQVNAGYRTIVDDRWAVIDANRDVAAVFDDIVHVMTDRGLCA